MPEVPAASTDKAVPTTPAALLAIFDDYMAAEGFRPGTRMQYRRVALRFLYWLEPQEIRLEEVTPQVVEAFLPARDASPSSWRWNLTALRSFFAALLAGGVIHSNPAYQTGRGFGAPMTAPAVPEPDVLTKQAAADEGQAEEPADSSPSLDQLKRQVYDLALDPIDDGDEDFEAALLLLASLHFGSRRVLPLARHTGVHPLRAAEFAARLRRNGVWTPGGKTAAEWHDEESGRLAFWLDVWVATGMLEKSVPAADPSLVASAGPNE